MTSSSPNGSGRRRAANLSQRITRLLMPTLAALIVIGGLALHTAVRNLLISQFDHALLTKARTLTSFPEPGRDGLNLGFTERPLPEFHGGPHAEFFQVWLSDGAVLAKSPSLGAEQELPRNIGPNDQPIFWKLDLPDGRPGRAVGLRLSSEQQSFSGSFAIELALARDSVQLGGVLRGLALAIALGGATLLALAWYGVRRATKMALDPVSQLVRDVAAIDATSLKTRLASEPLPSELQPIAEQINHLMQRLEAAFERERRFASNSAHELLTPVSELRIAAENAIDWPNDPEASGGLPTEARDLAIQMEHVVRSLLALSRAEASLTPLKLESFDLGELIEELLASAKEEIATRKLRITSRYPKPLSVTTDQVLARAILKNLTLNAVEYSIAGTELEIAAGRVGSFVEVTVRNAVEESAGAEAEHFCEPFWRGDKSHQSREHAGLGLALSKAFAQRLNGDLNIRAEDKHTVLATLKLADQRGR